MPVIKGVPKPKTPPGTNPLRAAVLRAWHGFASDPTTIGPGMATKPFKALSQTRRMRLRKLYNVPLVKGKRPPVVEDEIADLLGIPRRADIKMFLRKSGIFGF